MDSSCPLSGSVFMSQQLSILNAAVAGRSLGPVSPGWAALLRTEASHRIMMDQWPKLPFLPQMHNWRHRGRNKQPFQTIIFLPREEHKHSPAVTQKKQ